MNDILKGSLMVGGAVLSYKLGGMAVPMFWEAGHAATSPIAENGLGALYCASVALQYGGTAVLGLAGLIHLFGDTGSSTYSQHY